MTTRTSSAASSTNHRTIVYWGTTLLLAVECVVGGMMGALRLEPFIGIIRHLGYPAYFMTILSVWYVLAGLALLVPRLPRLKEWAYAGLIFNYTGAVGSRLAVGDGAGTLVAPIIFAGLTAASWALRPPTRRDLAANRAVFESAVSSRSGMITYWVTTTLVVAELALGGVWDILRIPYVLAIIEHLGYPSYLLVIMGVWKVLGAVALLVPRFPRLKEWAYAGAVFTYTGAVGSHLAVGDGAGTLVAPTIFAALTAASWALRPPARRDLAPS
jgi:uncharacterized membrane protein YphA (DoxX/SURF4 family)